MVNASEKVYCTFLVMARARVAPLKPTTIPRLELTAASVAARMDLNLIRELSSTSAWRYVDTNSNPADFASRGLDVDTFLKSEMLIRGPRFFHKPESSWPQVPDVKYGSLEDDTEVKVSAIVCKTVTTVTSLIEDFAYRFLN
nr:uncharacterized protein LOC113827275 [Penaeus vannamei]